MSDDLVTLDALLGADEAALEALAEVENSPWQELLEALEKGELDGAAPAPLVEAMLEREDVVEWAELAREAASAVQSEYFTTTIGPVKNFNRWFRAGVIAHRPAEDENVLRSRFLNVQEAPSEEVCAEARSLVDDLGRLQVHERLHVEAAVAMSARLLEEGRWTDALAAAEEVEGIIANTARETPPKGDLLGAIFAPPDWSPMAIRLRAAAMIGDLRFDEGFALLETVIDVRCGPVLDNKRFFQFDDPRETVLRQLAFAAQYAKIGHEEWLAVLNNAAVAFAEDDGLGPDLQEWALRFSPLSVLERAVLQMVTALRKDELLAIEPTYRPGPVVATVVKALESLRSERQEKAVASIADRLGGAPGVAELYADDATMVEHLRAVVGAWANA